MHYLRGSSGHYCFRLPCAHDVQNFLKRTVDTFLIGPDAFAMTSGKVVAPFSTLDSPLRWLISRSIVKNDMNELNE